MTKQTLLSIIIVASNNEHVFDCIDSLKPAISGIESEVILIDNASPLKVGEKVSSKYPFVKVIRREKNGGFGENNNMGMRIAKGKYILLLNDDTKIVDKNIFKEMISWMDSRPKAGIAGCGLLNSDEATYQGSGGYYPTLFRVFAWMSFLDDIPVLDRIIKPYHPLHGQSPLYKGTGYFKREHKQDWVTGAFFMMRRAAMDEAGLFDEDFFLYVEEVELAARFKDKGWSVWYLPFWKIVHYGMSTTGSEKATIFEFQNLILMYRKREASWKIPVLRAILKFGAALRIAVWSIMGKRKVAKIYEKAIKSF